MNKALVSVVLPAYNHERFVGAAIESVLGQTWSNLELIVIDDASRDRTWEVISSYTDPRIQASQHAVNQGAHITLNESLAMARGEFVAIINSDDVFASTRIAACLETLYNTGADLVGSDIVLIDAAGEPVLEHWWVRAFANLKRVWKETSDWHSTLLEGNVFMTTSNFFFRRSWLEAEGNFRDFRYVLDYEWLLRGLIEGRRLAWLDAPLLYYRLHESNTISEQPLAANLECAAMLRSLVPKLLGANELERLRLEHLTAQWSRIEQYEAEIWATLRHEALVAKETELLQFINDRDAWITERDWLIARQAEWIADRDRWLSERDAVIETQAQWIAERDARIASDQAALTLCREEKALLEASTSYRLGRRLTASGLWLRSLLARRQ